MKRIALLLLAFTCFTLAKAEDGSQLWLRYQPVNQAKVNGPECLAAQELRTYYQGAEATLVIDPTMAQDAYAIQGRAEAYIKGIRGSWSNVVGLPLYLVRNLAGKAGVMLHGDHGQGSSGQ